ncbi:ribosome maturation protein [Thamnocephalis sphaerospora]|uniref:Ribosome maturation protein n=1 Tax=Thamnocephalis sphaerospora TaxID=78915 RepID=A0A4P9XHN1_9FUNG|nr:ribosome maturation protein [Thamnocephalis sphaerospora]|eukprot:RKP04720.1 ribosome maturation protein [Thamnocephalis sphaerospora]
MPRRNSSSNMGDRVVFKSEDGDEFFVFVDPGMVPKWRKDRTIPLVDVVQTFEVFATDTGGNDGRAGRASLQSITNAMGVKSVDDAVQFVVEHGELRGRQDLAESHGRSAISNPTRGFGGSASGR